MEENLEQNNENKNSYQTNNTTNSSDSNYKLEDKELQHRVRELENKLALKDMEEQKHKLYQKLQVNSELSKTIDSFLDKYKIKEYQEFITEFTTFISSTSKRDELLKIIPKSESTQDIDIFASRFKNQ